MNLATAITLVLVGVAVILAIVATARRRRRCASGCEGCALRENCSKAPKN